MATAARKAWICSTWELPGLRLLSASAPTRAAELRSRVPWPLRTAGAGAGSGSVSLTPQHPFGLLGVSRPQPPDGGVGLLSQGAGLRVTLTPPGPRLTRFLQRCQPRRAAGRGGGGEAGPLNCCLVAQRPSPSLHSTKEAQAEHSDPSVQDRQTACLSGKDGSLLCSQQNK